MIMKDKINTNDKDVTSGQQCILYNPTRTLNKSLECGCSLSAKGTPVKNDCHNCQWKKEQAFVFIALSLYVSTYIPFW